MANLIIRFVARVGGGGVITWKGDRPNQAVFWELKSYNTETGIYDVALGSLKYDKTHTDASCLCTNIYVAPVVAPPANTVDMVITKWLS